MTEREKLFQLYISDPVIKERLEVWKKINNKMNPIPPPPIVWDDKSNWFVWVNRRKRRSLGYGR